MQSDCKCHTQVFESELTQEGSVATGDTGTQIEQLQDTIENLSSFNEEHEHSRLVETVSSTSDPVSATSFHHACQKIIDAQQEKLQCLEAKIRQFELELGRRSFLEDKQKRNEKVNQSSRTHANEQSKSCSASGASYDFTGMEEKPFGGAGLPQEPGKLNQH